MTSRECPHCQKTWYSADAEGVWICPECEGKIPVPEVKYESN